MPDGLCIAKTLAEKIRFSGDTYQNTRSEAISSKSIASQFYCNELSISQEVTPSLYNSLKIVYKRLHIPEKSVEAFVYASPEIQANCFAGTTTECVIRFSSSLIDILDSNEFEFVAGHELGHFLLEHGISNQEKSSHNLEYYIQQRAQELSADRFGLLACKSLNVAVKALMKTISGLTSKHLRFDVGTFISQLKKLSDSSLNDNQTTTHPSILMRCRALLWFSLNDDFVRGSHEFLSDQLTKIDKQIHADLYKYVDGSVRKKIQEVKDNLSMWMVAYKIVETKIFTKEKQLAFAKIFDQNTLEKLKNYLRDISSEEVQDAVYERLKEARNELENLIPNSFEAEIKSIEEVLNGFVNNKNPNC